MGECLKALQETKGNIEDAFVVLRKRGMASAQKKASREPTRAPRALTSMPEERWPYWSEPQPRNRLRARTDDFQELLKEIAMHIADSDPRYVKPEDMTPADLEREREIYHAQAGDNRQARQGDRAISGRQDGQVRPRGLPAGAALHQRPGRSIRS